MSVTRRTLLAGAGAASLTTLLASCAGFTGQPSGGSSKGSRTLTFTTWASDTEKAAYTKLIAGFEKANTGVTVKPNFVPYAQMFTNIDAQLSAGNAPDVFRAGYGQIGGYAKQGQLLDLSSSLGGEKSRFIPAFWEAVSYDGRAYGVPQQTDTSAIVYNTSLMRSAGISSFPDSLDSAWSFDEFAAAMRKLRSSLPASKFPFADNWQLAGSPRWLTWLFAAGGRLLDEDLTKSAIVSSAGTKALDYTKAFFDEQWVPQNSSTKSNTYADTTWLAGTTAMVSAGNFLLPEFTGAKFDWGVTYLPKDVRGADDLGGNALVATKGGDEELATEFLKYMVTDDAMSTFCGEALELPTLTSLVGKDLGWDAPKGVMPVFVDQATTITAADVAQLTVPASAQITTVLTDELEAAFRQGQSTATTLRNIAAGVEKAVA
ncbi:ABC transporter substrate-binding protein [Amnibacterium kyonggiense]|uniref:Carbohydrate ABC transporter substrate-binding protein (CUT1 family) n=1 Tax=Amnibacterium kyonggiense TaxID=595671 RepID=A0A4R7FF60_9MICO|nr:sugar ABC transporter substrate-binding protein [Amnibacterium kyonggiense]TDS74811.1 carbohydrate ABC transporter substrate-binding protein (CUT1 family) [Amnibacterium kyonggiense]